MYKDKLIDMIFKLIIMFFEIIQKIFNIAESLCATLVNLSAVAKMKSTEARFDYFKQQTAEHFHKEIDAVTREDIRNYLKSLKNPE